MSYSHSFSNFYYGCHISDDLSTVFDADTVVADDVPSSTPLELAPLTATARAAPADYHHNSNNGSPHPSQESSGTSVSELLRRINSCPLAVPFTIMTARTTPTSKGISINHHQSFPLSSSQTLTTKDFTKYEAKWRSKFQELCAFKLLHGHTNVTQRNQDYRELGTWVSRQRSHYNYLKTNRKSNMTSERIEMLNSIGFEWVLNYKSSWNKRFTELLKYKEKYGNTNVAVRNKDYRQLGLWVCTQRQEYKKLKANKKSSMTLDRIQMLNSIGFIWSCRPGRV